MPVSTRSHSRLHNENASVVPVKPQGLLKDQHGLRDRNQRLKRSTLKRAQASLNEQVKQLLPLTEQASLETFPRRQVSSSENSQAIFPSDTSSANVISNASVSTITSESTIPVSKALIAPTVHEDIDAENENEPIFVSEYVIDIYDYLFEVEKNDHIDPDYISRQPNFTERMRGILFNWLAELHSRFQLLSETLYLSCFIVDKYLSKVEVPKDRLQLVAITATLISTKFEEIYPIQIKELLFMSDNIYTRNQILELETQILSVINYRLSSPFQIHFLRRWSKAGDSSFELHSFAKFLCEESILSYSFLKYLPSKIAAAALLLARCIFKRSPVWTDTLIYYTTYKVDDLIPCVKELCAFIRFQRAKRDSNNGHPLLSIEKKYSNPNLCSSSHIVIPDGEIVESQIKSLL